MYDGTSGTPPNGTNIGAFALAGESDLALLTRPSNIYVYGRPIYLPFVRADCSTTQ